jgi:hypothetical protein
MPRTRLSGILPPVEGAATRGTLTYPAARVMVSAWF